MYKVFFLMVLCIMIQMLQIVYEMVFLEALSLI